MMLQIRMYLTLALILGLSFTLLGQDKDEMAYYCPPCNRTCDTLVFDSPGNCEHCSMQLLKQTPTQHMNSMKIGEMTIGFYLQNGVEVLDFAGPMEVFAYAGFNVITISKTKKPIISQGIVTITPEYSIKNAPPVDVLAFFGGNGMSASDDADVMAWIRSQDSVQYHFSVCTGAFFLAKSGLLEGKEATTFHSAIDDLKAIAPNTNVHSNARWVDNGRIITTAGVSAGIDGALHFVRKLAGQEAAVRIAEYMEYDKWDPKAGITTTEGE